MVALTGRGWGLAPSLAAMVREADRIAPRRSERSDGSIGDQSHASRSSFHNPSGRYVDAVDLTHDPASGFDAHARARQIAARGDGRIDHIISNREIWAASSWLPWRRGVWRRYTGANPHTQHAHFAVKRNNAGRSSTAPWWSGAPAPLPAPPHGPPPPPRVKDDAMFTYSYDKAGAAPEILVLVAGGKRIRLTGEQLLVNRERLEASPTHLGKVDVDEETRFAQAFGPIIT